MQVHELKDELEKVGEPTDGLKAVLVERLTEARAEAAAPEPEPAPAPAPPRINGRARVNRMTGLRY